MKFLTGILLGFTCMFMAGCDGSSAPTNTMENAKQSDVDEYNRMLAESNASMVESDAAAAAAQAAEKKK